ncbi:hypothetical protein Lp90_2765 [Lactiplantibacillus plantarum]|uniref:hypothetical protein n=1 Tax=Lactiplantibacillus plantarum TaxID=1590 RepID=UPI0004DCFD04|nr:hypothetical protein [Lactiplantibacillus plantarum]KEZ12596.1 hypothetical protein Lp90_2765 [Lactiplantibacillus plantarum]KZU51268.1 hypothetical protein Nizo2776_1688 [Lactiplantibacillus plantarum]WNW18428.1 hypothetical protein RUP00_13050 [Lactiplantibacillus plantarum]
MVERVLQRLPVGIAVEWRTCAYPVSDELAVAILATAILPYNCQSDSRITTVP